MGAKIGLLGGTFDPIHMVHLFMGTLAVEELGLAKVIFMPAGIPPHKEGDSITPAVHRVAMAKLAIQGQSRFEVSELELSREPPSYTIDTVRVLQRCLGPGALLYLIVGSDSLLELPTWKDRGELVSRVTLAVFPRPGHAVEEARLDGPGKLIVLPADGVSFGVCSSCIRARVKKGKCIRYLVPSAVEEYIAEHGLYRED